MKSSALTREITYCTLGAILTNQKLPKKQYFLDYIAP